MMILEIILIIVGFVAAYYIGKKTVPFHEITPPRLENNPSYDVIVTETTPILSFFNAQGGIDRKYIIEIDKNKNFNSPDKLRLKLAENDKFISTIKLDNNNRLCDKSRYYWRARTISATGEKSDWTISRFFVDTSSDDNFSGLMRASIKSIEASAGYNVNNIIDYDDPGLTTFWQSPPPAPGKKEHWIKFDLGSKTKICRLWLLSNPGNSDGWLKEFVLQYSNDGKKFIDIKNTNITNNDTFRNIIDFKEINARYFRLFIKKYIGYAAQINEIILYTKKTPSLPTIPKKPYVLVIGNEHNGYTFTELAKHIESLHLGIATVTIAYYNASWEMIKKLKNKPVAIILSGNNADYPNLPMFEHNGEFEIIRNSNIPILGICAGHQFLAMAYGYTRASSMGWSDISAMEPVKKMTHIDIVKNDPIFKGLPSRFIGPEIHGWAVTNPASEFEVIARSSYIQAQKNTKRLIYGIQFHGEIDVSYNDAKPVIKNFLEIILNKTK